MKTSSIRHRPSFSAGTYCWPVVAGGAVAAAVGDAVDDAVDGVVVGVVVGGDGHGAAAVGAAASLVAA